MRLIDADAFIENLKKFLPGIHQTYLAAAVMRIVKEVIDKQPTIEAKPVVHAHWQKYDDSEFCYCSYCGKPAAKDDDVSWHGYCPVCGALMDEEVSK